LITSTKQIKPSVIKALKGAKGPRGQSVTGLTGPQGPKGDTGAAGAAGAAGATHVVKRFATATADSTLSGTIASCNPGEVATGGGTDWSSATGGAIPVVSYGQPAPFSMDNAVPTGWRGAVRNLNSPTGTVTALVWVICASP